MVQLLHVKGWLQARAEYLVRAVGTQRTRLAAVSGGRCGGRCDLRRRG